MAIPDVDIHPVATGLASKLAEAHSNQQHPLILYSGWFCPFVQRSWITLEELGLNYEYREINPYKKEKSFLELNPRGLVPTLGVPVDGSHSNSSGRGVKTENGVTRKPLIESNVICEYLDSYAQTHPQDIDSGRAKVRSLFPDSRNSGGDLYDVLYNRAHAKVWIDFVGSRIIPAFHRVLQHTDKSPYELKDAAHELRGHVKTWIAEAHSTGPFWAGQEFGMVDVALVPWAVRFWVLDEFKNVNIVPENSEADEPVWRRWNTWLHAVEARDSVKNTLSEKEHYLPIYQRYAEDKAQSELAKATRQGRGVP